MHNIIVPGEIKYTLSNCTQKYIYPSMQQVHLVIKYVSFLLCWEQLKQRPKAVEPYDFCLKDCLTHWMMSRLPPVWPPLFIVQYNRLVLSESSFLSEFDLEDR